MLLTTQLTMDDRLSLERSNPAAVDEYNASKLLKFKVTKTDINIKYHLQRLTKSNRSEIC